jgi:putative hydrolase of the HAD superfamily
MIRAIIFDLDNTLVDFMAMKKRAVEAAAWAMVDCGLPMSVEDATTGIFKTYSTLGIESQEVFDEFLTNEIGHIDYKVLSSGIVAYRTAREAALQPYPYAIETIISLIRSGQKLAILSDAPRREAWLRLCQVGLHHYFDVVVTFEDTGFHKPSPEPFARALADLEVDPKEAIMIGDWPERDMVGARAAGLWTVWAKYGMTSEATSTDADFEIDEVRDLIGVIDEINTRTETGEQSR